VMTEPELYGWREAVWDGRGGGRYRAGRQISADGDSDALCRVKVLGVRGGHGGILR
jgi:hypothetical protein